jgi:hypothetical protein
LDVIHRSGRIWDDRVNTVEEPVALLLCRLHVSLVFDRTTNMSSLSLGKGNNDVLKAATNGQQLHSFRCGWAWKRHVTTTSFANESKLGELRSKVFDDVKSFQPNMPLLPTIRSQPGALDEMKCAFLLLDTTHHAERQKNQRCRFNH